MQPLLPMDWIPILAALIICSFPLDELFNPDLEDKKHDEVSEEEEVVEKYISESPDEMAD